MAMTLKDLESQLSGLQTYTPETEDALRTRAENIYNPQYQQDLQSLRDSLQQGLNQQSRNAISAGMQRSSYNQSALAALRGQGLRAEAQLGAQRDANIANLLNQLIEGEKDRKLNADANKDNLLLQLYQLANKGSGKAKDDKKEEEESLLDKIKKLFGGDDTDTTPTLRINAATETGGLNNLRDPLKANRILG